ncbi:MAG: stalk domain-containing protein [Armatimonadota bacterium]
MSRKRLVRASRWIAAVFLISTASQALAGVNIVLPRPDDLVGGSSITCVAEFSRTVRPVSRLEFLVDGQVLAWKAYQRPTTESGATFVWDATGVPPGKHSLTVRALSGNTAVASDTVEVVVAASDGSDAVPPQVHIFSPKPGSVVKGRVPISIHAGDNDSVAMVSLFIDKELKLLQNVAPFQYVWDTTRYPNGLHTIEVWAYDRAQNKAEGRPVVVRVANETGRTDLQEHPEVQPTESAASGVPEPTAERPAVSPAEPQTPSTPLAQAKPVPQIAPSARAVSRSTIPEAKPRTSEPRRPSPASVAGPTQVRHSQAGLPPAKVLMANAAVQSSVLEPRSTTQASPRTVQPAAGRPTKLAEPVRVTKPATAKPAAVFPGPTISLPEQRVPSPRLIAKVIGPRTETGPSSPAPRSAQPTKPAPEARSIIAKADVKPAVVPPRVQSPLSVTRPAQAKGSSKVARVVVKDTLLSLDVPPVLKNGSAVIPLRQVFEHAGGIVMWLPAEKIARVQVAGKQVQLTIGSRTAMVDGTPVRLDRPAFIRDGRTMVPARFIAEMLDMRVVYDPAEKLVRLYLR